MFISETCVYINWKQRKWKDLIRKLLKVWTWNTCMQFTHKYNFTASRGFQRTKTFAKIFFRISETFSQNFAKKANLMQNFVKNMQQFRDKLQKLQKKSFFQTFWSVKLVYKKMNQKQEIFGDSRHFLLVIQGYPQGMRLQRRLYGICLIRFLAFRVPCRPKLEYFCT